MLQVPGTQTVHLLFEINALEITGTFKLASRLIVPRENVYFSDLCKMWIQQNCSHTLSSWWVIAIEDVQVKLDLPQVG